QTHCTKVQVIEDVAERCVNVGGLIFNAQPAVETRSPQVRNNLEPPTLRAMDRWSGLRRNVWSAQQNTNRDCKYQVMLSHDKTPSGCIEHDTITDRGIGRASICIGDCKKRNYRWCSRIVTARRQFFFV